MHATTAIYLAAGVSLLLILVEHYLPWQLILGNKLPRLAAYVLGLLAILVPLTIIFWIVPVWTSGQIIAAIWAVSAAAGLGTLAAWLVDAWLHQRARALAAETEGRILRDGQAS